MTVFQPVREVRHTQHTVNGRAERTSRAALERIGLKKWIAGAILQRKSMPYRSYCVHTILRIKLPELVSAMSVFFFPSCWCCVHTRSHVLYVRSKCNEGPSTQVTMKTIVKGVWKYVQGTELDKFGRSCHCLCCCAPAHTRRRKHPHLRAHLPLHVEVDVNVMQLWV